MKKYFLLCMFHVLFCCVLFAQDEEQAEIDSLEKILKTSLGEKERANVQHKLGKIYHIDSAS